MPIFRQTRFFALEALGSDGIGVVQGEHLVGRPIESDLLIGGAGNDTIEGFGGSDHLEGGAGDDILSTLGDTYVWSYNHLYGGVGNDTLLGGDAQGNHLDGGDDDDLIVGGRSRDHLYGGTGDDTLDGGHGADFLQGGMGNDLMTGGAGHDHFQIGFEGSQDHMATGHDTITDFGDADMLHFGAPGMGLLTVRASYTRHDTLLVIGEGTAHESTVLLQNYIVPARDLPQDGLITPGFLIMGYAENVVVDDHLTGSADVADVLYGALGDDTLEGFGGGDHLDGGAGNDILRTTGSVPILNYNRLYGGAGDDTLEGGAQNDSLEGGADNDVLSGGAGEDWLTGGAGDDVMTGGADVDVFEFALHDGAMGHDTITDFSDGDVLLVGGPLGTVLTLDATYIGRDTLLTIGAGTAYESTILLQNYIVPGVDLPWDGTIPAGFALTGSLRNVVSDDHLIGFADAADVLEGWQGNDTLEGLGGADDLEGGAGDDVLLAGAGDDWLTGGVGDDLMSGGTGRDVFELDLNERAVGHDTITDFSDGDALLLWGPLSTELSLSAARIGNDTLLTIGEGTAYESAVLLQNYIVTDGDLPWNGAFYAGFTLTGRVDNMVVDDHLTGSAGAADALYGGYGADTLDGFGGGDNLFGGDGNDVLRTTGSLSDWDLNYLDGGAGNDTLEGGAQDDIVVGGTGDDLLSGGEGADHFEFVLSTDGTAFTAFGSDIVTDFSLGDVIRVGTWGERRLDVRFVTQGEDTLVLLDPGMAHESAILIKDYHIAEHEWSLTPEALYISSWDPFGAV